MNNDLIDKLKEEIISVSSGDTESFYLEMSRIDTALQEMLSSKYDVFESLTSVAKARTQSLEQFLARKKLVKDTLEEM